MGLDNTTIVLRLLLAFGLGATLGLERELRGHQAGLRTHILVCLGACLFTLCSIYVALPLVGDTTHEARADIGRIASQIVVGISFLGGGAIIRHETRIKGLTTAANLWLTASVGLACGLGFTLAAGTAVTLALFALVGLRFVESYIVRLRARYRMPSEDEPPSNKPP